MSHTTATSLTLALARTLMSSLAQDEDTTAPFWTAAQKTTCLQDWYVRLYERYADRLAQFTGAGTFGSISASTKKKRTAVQTIQKWRHAYIETVSTDFAVGTELEIMKPERVRALQITEPTTGTPTRIGFERVAGITVASSGDSVNYWDAYLHPIPSGTVYVSAHVLTTPYVPAADADMFDCSPATARVVAAMAAIECASLAGWDSDFLEQRWRVIPDEWQAVLRAELAQKLTMTQTAAGAPQT